MEKLAPYRGGRGGRSLCWSARNATGTENPPCSGFSRGSVLALSSLGFTESFQAPPAVTGFPITVPGIPTVSQVGREGRANVLPRINHFLKTFPETPTPTASTHCPDLGDTAPQFPGATITKNHTLPSSLTRSRGQKSEIRVWAGRVLLPPGQVAVLSPCPHMWSYCACPCPNLPFL